MVSRVDVHQLLIVAVAHVVCIYQFSRDKFDVNCFEIEAKFIREVTKIWGQVREVVRWR